MERLNKNIFRIIAFLAIVPTVTLTAKAERITQVGIDEDTILKLTGEFEVPSPSARDAKTLVKFRVKLEDRTNPNPYSDEVEYKVQFHDTAGDNETVGPLYEFEGKNNCR